MSSVNKVILVGNLGRDAESKYSPSGEFMTNFSLATSYKKKSGEEETEWHRVSLFGERFVGVAKYLTKGKTVYLEGKIKSRKYTDKAGVEKTSYDIIGSELQLLGSGGERREGAGHHRESAPSVPTSADIEDLGADTGSGDDIPF